jgi:hypothetical protein
MCSNLLYRFRSYQTHGKKRGHNYLNCVPSFNEENNPWYIHFMLSLTVSFFEVVTEGACIGCWVARYYQQNCCCYCYLSGLCPLNRNTVDVLQCTHSAGFLGRTKANQSGLGNCYHSVNICLQAPENHKIKNISFLEDKMLHPIKNVTSWEILKHSWMVLSVAVCSEWWCVSTSRASSTSILYCVLEEQTNGSAPDIISA